MAHQDDPHLSRCSVYLVRDEVPRATEQDHPDLASGSKSFDDANLGLGFE